MFVHCILLNYIYQSEYQFQDWNLAGIRQFPSANTVCLPDQIRPLEWGLWEINA